MNKAPDRIPCPDFVAVLDAIERSRRAQARQHAQLRDELKRMVSSEEFNSAMVVLAELFKELDESLEQRWEMLTAELAAINDKLTDCGNSGLP